MNSFYTNYSEQCGGPNRLSVYTSTGSVTVIPVPTVQTTNLPGNWQYSQCFAYVHVRMYPLALLTSFRSSVSLRVHAYSPCTRSSSQTTTRPQIVSLYAPRLDTLQRVWSTVLSAVCAPLFFGVVSNLYLHAIFSLRRCIGCHKQWRDTCASVGLQYGVLW